jgi:hypothetical protein
MADLIVLARAKINLPDATSADDNKISLLINAASRTIQRYCRRDFVATAYDELYNGRGDGRLILNQFPVISVQSVRYRPITVLKVTNTNTAVNQQARVTVTATGLSLSRIASGVTGLDTVTFAGNTTLNAVATAVNALGNGWNAQVSGDYGLWPAADLRAPQGALTAAGQFAELKMHTYELAGYQLDETRGWLLRAIPYTDPELLHPEDLIWPSGINNFRVQYTAGFASIPDDVQEAAAELTASLFKELGRNQNLEHETIAGYAYTALNHGAAWLPRGVRVLLANYRNHRVLNAQG